MASNCFSIPVIFTDNDHEPKAIWTDYGEPTQRTLPKGWVKDPGRRVLSADMIWEKDVRIPLRDGIELLADVFRPVSSDHNPVPAIVPWSPYGKTGSGFQQLDLFPWRVGVPRDATSGLEKWEAPDPAEWCPRGYAVVNIDARGSFKSQGDFYVYGTQEGRDGYDSIEWIATQPWCNEKVTMAGNSWLGTTQWFIAAEQPPHLSCIAPWEGLGDYYRESICRGGIPDHAFWDVLMGWACGPGKREDVAAMVDKHGLFNDYWEDKKPKLRKINVPMYATASYSTGLHTEGSLRGFMLSASTEKWLRWTSTQEWHDIYQKENIDDLQKFFDKYLKGIDNGWERTPQYRLSLLGYNRPSVVNRPETSYPPAAFTNTTLYLDNKTSKLAASPPKGYCSSTYQADSQTDEGLYFSYKFDSYTELCGISRVKLFMSAVEHDDMAGNTLCNPSLLFLTVTQDVYVVLRKLDMSGKRLMHQNIPMRDLPPDTQEKDVPVENVWFYVGPNGRLRASHRAVIQEQLEGLSDAEYRERMTDAYVYHPHTHKELLTPGEVVELDISLWPGGMVFDAGESLQLEVKGRHPVLPEFNGLDKNIVNFNRGRHRLHSGEANTSYLVVNLRSGGEEAEQT